MSDGARIRARLRALSFCASAGVVSIFVAMLAISSRTPALHDNAARGVEVIMSPRAPPPERTPTRRPAGRAHVSARQDAGREAADRAALAQMLACLRPRAQRPSWCPSGYSSDAPSPGGELPVGGDFHQPPRIDRERIYTRAELATIVMPPCEGVCIGIGPPPPPPSRSAEQVCEDANLGGPCRAPPFREDEVVHQRHSN